MENLPTTIESVPHIQDTAFSSIKGFEAAQRMAIALSASTMIPKAYQGGGKEAIGNAIVALELSQRIGASPFAVFQNLHVIQGRPSWSSSFIIAALNTCGRFSPIRFEMSGEGDGYGCTAWTYEKANKDRLDGPKVTIAMAKAEGWMGKPGSKWKTMPELMLRYRAAAFFGRLYAPDVLMGMHSEEEIIDSGVTVLSVPDNAKVPAHNVAVDLNTAIMGETVVTLAQEVPEQETSVQEEPVIVEPASEPVEPTVKTVDAPTEEPEPATTPTPGKTRRLNASEMQALRNECMNVAEQCGLTADIELLEKEFNEYMGKWSEKQCMKAIEFFSTTTV